MVLNVSMTIKAEDFKQIKKYPFMICWGVFLQFVPMALFALLLGKLFSHWPDHSTGQLLLGSLPADVSAPLMVYLAGGSTAIGTAMLILVKIGHAEKVPSKIITRRRGIICYYRLANYLN